MCRLYLFLHNRCTHAMRQTFTSPLNAYAAITYNYLFDTCSTAID